MERKRHAVQALIGLSLFCWTVSRPSISVAEQTCSCAATYCENGSQQGCTIECPKGEEAICVCDVNCDGSGKPAGLNRCRCQPLDNQNE
jgi:hypothetical protein